MIKNKLGIGIAVLCAIGAGVAFARLPRDHAQSHAERHVFVENRPYLTTAENNWLNQLLNQIEDVYVGEHVYLDQAGITADQCIQIAVDAMRDQQRSPEARAWVIVSCSSAVLQGEVTEEQESRIFEAWLSIMMGSGDEVPRVLLACRAAVRENRLEQHPAFADAVARVNADPDYQQFRADILGGATPVYSD